MEADSRKSECGETPQSGRVICRQPLQPQNELSTFSGQLSALSREHSGLDERGTKGEPNIDG